MLWFWRMHLSQVCSVGGASTDPRDAAIARVYFHPPGREEAAVAAGLKKNWRPATEEASFDSTIHFMPLFFWRAICLLSRFLFNSLGMSGNMVSSSHFSVILQELSDHISAARALLSTRAALAVSVRNEIETIVIVIMMRLNFCVPRGVR